MIRNISTVAIALAVFVSLSSIVQIANAVEPEFNLDISAFEDHLSIGHQPTPHAFSWTPDISYRDRVINLYEQLILPTGADHSAKLFDDKDPDQRIYSFEIYQGDGLNDLRDRAKHKNNLTLPDEDKSAYGVSIKQRF